MELKEAIEILKERCEYYKKVDECGFDHNQEHLALDTVLKVLDMPEEEVVFYGTRSAGKTARRPYEMGLIVGTKRERVYWEDKIKGQIEQLKKEMPRIACNKGCDKCFDENWKPLYRGSSFTFCYAYHQLKALQELLKGE